MTERDITGDAKSAYRKAQAIAKERGLLDSDLRTIADGVREFDAQRSVEVRTQVALEKIASNTAPERDPNAESRGWEERRLRRREVYAQELLAVAYMADDVNDPDLTAIRGSVSFRRLVDRLKGPSPDAAP